MLVAVVTTTTIIIIIITIIIVVVVSIHASTSARKHKSPRRVDLNL
jgi:hypothetical protein